MKAWALISARGGSKSIPRKNMVALKGVPLIDYGAAAAKAAGCFERIVCSTDDAEIMARCKALFIEADRRPAHLATDDAKVDDVGRDFLERSGQRPDVLFLIQPTSPFLLPAHILGLLKVLADDPEAMSAHTITACGHNHHAWNQRERVGARARFLFPEARAKARNKQEKPELFVFGNLIAARSDALLAGGGFYAPPCAVCEIPHPYEFDLDSIRDVPIAEALLSSGCVELPHMSQFQPTLSNPRARGLGAI